MLTMVAAAALFCFGNGICYDQARVKVRAPEVATIVVDGNKAALIVINCNNKTHTIYAEGDSVEGPYQEGSIADEICVKYLPVE